MIVAAAFLMLVALPRGEVANGGPAFTKLAEQAKAEREADHIEQAIALYESAVAAKPGWSEGWWYLGSLLYDRDRYGEAAKALHRFVGIEPKSAPGWTMLGLTEYELKRYDEALPSLRRGLGIGVPADGELHRIGNQHLVQLLSRSEEYETALTVLGPLAQKEEKNPALIVAAGIAGLRKPILPTEVPKEEQELVIAAGQAVYDAIGLRGSKATQEFGELVARYPQEQWVHYLYGSFLLTGDADRGVAELKRELDQFPDSSPTLLQLAFEYLKRGDAKSALPYAELAVKLDPQIFQAHGALGRALVETGETERGVKELELAVKQAPESPQTRIALASAYARLGRSQDAARERAEFLKLRRSIDPAPVAK